MALQRPVILMRPGEANNRLAAALDREGIRCWRWPAFRIELPGKEDCDMVQERLANLDDVEMVILPSPAAVAAVAHWVREWPAHLTLATVGEGTARVIRAAWGPDVKLIYPQGDAESSGSEALWEIIKHRGAPSRVLFLRGQTGREWLPTQFRSIGSDVITLCAYVRVPIELSPEQRTDVLMASHGPSPIVYVTSTDAVDALFHAIRPVSEVREWLTRGVAVTLHPRIVRRLQEAGFTHIEVTSTDDATVASHIRANLR